MASLSSFLKELSLFEFFFSAANIGVTLVYDVEHFRQPDLNDLNWMRDPTRDPQRDPITGIGEPFEKMYKIFYILDMNNNFKPSIFCILSSGGHFLRLKTTASQKEDSYQFF